MKSASRFHVISNSKEVWGDSSSSQMQVTSSQDIFGPTNPTWRTKIDCSVLWKVKTSWHLFLCVNILNFWRKRQIFWMLNGRWVVQQGQKLIVFIFILISTFSYLYIFSYISFLFFLLSLRLHYLAENKDDFPCSLVLLKKDQKSHSKVIGHSRLNKVLGKPKAAFLTCGQYVQMRNNEDGRLCT